MDNTNIDWEKITQFSTPEDSIGYLFWQTTRLWQQRVSEILEDLEINHTQFVMLVGVAWLTRDDCLVTQVRLAEFCRIDVMLTSQMVRKLEKKNLIQRKSHPSDTRAKILFLTIHGKDILKEALKLVSKLDRKFFGHCNQRLLKSELLELYSSVQREQ